MTQPISARADDDRFEDRRAYPRVSVALPAFLQANGTRHSAQILDLSSGGAKLSCAATLESGTAVFLDCGSLGCAGIVRWQTGGALGICFDHELDGREVSALADRSSALAALMKSRG
jgi:hypothetical protein